ncbi:MAG: hypothetical protein ACYSUX_04060 [Planctomycetota bacterium]|jgi:hypothetical protein
MSNFKKIKKFIVEITEISLLLVALGIVLEILFGSMVPFWGGIMTNLLVLISNLGEHGFIGLVALGIVLYIFRRSKAFA